MKIFLGRMPEHRHHEEMRHGHAESHWHEDPESRRRRTRSEMPWDDWDDDDVEGRRGRRSRSEMYDDPESRRRRSRSEMYGGRIRWTEIPDEMEDAESRRRRMHDDWEAPEGRRRRTRSEMDHHWDEEPDGRRRTRACDEEHYYPEHERHRIGYAATHEHPHASMGDGVAHHMEHGMAAVKKLAPALESVLEDATKVLESPPQTWPAYLHRKDYAGIVKMETKELLSALEEKKPVPELRKELVHTIAALFKLAMS